MLKLTAEQGLNKNAFYERVKKSSDWLHWLASEVCHANGSLSNRPDWLSDYRVCLIDATDEAKQGSNGAGFRLHYCVDLFALSLVEMHLTDHHIGETLSHSKQFGQGDLVVADQAYSSLKAISYLSKYQSDFVLRCRSNTFTFYNDAKEKVSLPELLKDLVEEEYRSL